MGTSCTYNMHVYRTFNIKTTYIAVVSQLIRHYDIRASIVRCCVKKNLYSNAKREVTTIISRYGSLRSCTYILIIATGPVTLINK